MKLKVLIGYSTCQFTREAFEAAGVECWTCDLRESDTPNHIQGDIWQTALAPENRDQWAMAVLHPDCTYLTTSAAWAFKDPNYEKYPGVGYHQRIKPGTPVGAKRRALQEEALENFRRLLDLPFPVGIENPGTSFINRAIRGPDQVIHPYMFGDDASKGTGLWLNGLPKLEVDPEQYVKPRIVGGLPRWANQTDSGQNRLSPSDDRWLARSRTYQGIAKALGSQWGKFIQEKQNAQG